MYLQLADRRKTRVHGYYRPENYVPSHWRYLSDQNTFSPFQQRVIASQYLQDGINAIDEPLPSGSQDTPGFNEALDTIKKVDFSKIGSWIDTFSSLISHVTSLFTSKKHKEYLIRKIKRDAAFAFFNAWRNEWNQILIKQVGQQIADIITSSITGNNLTYINQSLLTNFNPAVAINKNISLAYLAAQTSNAYVTQSTTGYVYKDWISEIKSGKTLYGWTPTLQYCFDNKIDVSKIVTVGFDKAVSKTFPDIPESSSLFNLKNLGIGLAVLSFIK